MATRSRIGILENGGSVKSIYCHWDGYPSNNGELLTKHWSDTDKILKLIKLGDISSLGSEIGSKQDFNQPTDRNWCLAYGRDRGETRIRAQHHNTIQDFLNDGEQYNYLWDGDQWICYDGNDIDAVVDLYQADLA